MCNELSKQWIAQDIESFLVEADDTTLSAYNSELEYLANHETNEGEERFYSIDLSDRTFDELKHEYRLRKQEVASNPTQLEWQIVLEAYALELKARAKGNPWLKLNLPMELL